MAVFGIVAMSLDTGEAIHEVLPKSLIDRVYYHHSMGPHTFMDQMKSSEDDAETRLFGQLHLDTVHTAGVSRFLNPTYLGMRVRFRNSTASSTHRDLIWRARWLVCSEAFKSAPASRKTLLGFVCV